MLGQEQINEVIASTDVGEVNINTNPQSVIGDKRYYGNNHLGNNSVTFTDRKLPESYGQGGIEFFMADIDYFAEYYPYGMILRDGGNIASYTFQGQEVDNEVKKEGNSINYKYRMHDPRVGRFFAVDPLAAKYPHNSPYAFSENVVINAVELEGLERAYVYNMVQQGDLWIRSYSHEEINEDLVERYQYKYQYWDQEGNIIETKIEERAASQIDPNQGFYDNLIDYHLNEGNYLQALKWKAKKTDNAIKGHEGFGEGMKLVGATVGTILSGGTLAASAGVWGTFSAGVGLVVSLDEFTGVGNDETLLESTLREHAGDLAADFFKGAKMAVGVHKTAKGIANVTITLSSGKMIDGTYDTINQVLSFGDIAVPVYNDLDKPEKSTKD